MSRPTSMNPTTLNIVTEGRFHRTSDGAVWGHASFGPSAWDRYLEAFERVQVVGRVRGAVPEPGSVRIDHPPNISVHALPYYEGPAGLVKAGRAVRQSLATLVAADSAFMIRVPTTAGNTITRALIRSCRPYGVEVVGDPADVFAAGVVEHPLRPVIRSATVQLTRIQCRHATTAVYVTRKHLQRRYPPGANTFVVAATNVVLPKGALAAGSRRYSRGCRPTVVSVGSMDQMYKGFDVLIKATAIARDRGAPFEVRIVGDGRYREALEALSRIHSLEGSVTFTGQLTSEGVRSELAGAHLFVLASRTEGMPRALIEAMAAGLPSIGSRVGGIPELLEAEDLVPPGDASALADAINSLLDDPARCATQSDRNKRLAAEIAGQEGNSRRAESLLLLRERTDAWAAARQPEGPI